jgi:hypothetical protein
MAIKGNIIVDQGSSFQTSINVTDDDENPIDLTNYTAVAQMRKHYTSSNAVSFTTTISPALGVVTLALTANATNAIPAGRYVYDCELTDNNGTVTRLVEGIVTVTPGVTR